jgi:peptide/nickel transport system permease protein
VASASSIARRLVIYVAILIALIVVTFVVYAVTPVEPAQFLVDYQHSSPAQIAAARHLLGVDRPLATQIKDYFGALVHGDLGSSWQGASIHNGKLVPGPAVWPQLRYALAVTASTTLGGACLLALVALPLGIAAARRPKSTTNRLGTFVTLAGISAHPLLIALLLKLFVTDRAHLLPGTGYCPLRAVPHTTCQGPQDWASHLILPWVTFAICFLPSYFRMIRNHMEDALSQDYVRTAEAKGAGAWRVTLRHALPNAIPATLTLVALDIGTVVGVTIFIDSVFGLSGLGITSVRALSGSSFDRPLILGTVIVVATVIFLLNLALEALHRVLDPRLR